MSISSSNEDCNSAVSSNAAINTTTSIDEDLNTTILIYKHCSITADSGNVIVSISTDRLLTVSMNKSRTITIPRHDVGVAHSYSTYV